VDFNKHTWVHQGNINKVKKLIMEVEEFQRIRIEALENKVKENNELLENKNNCIQLGKDIIKQLEHQIESLEAELKLENENKRSIVTDLELDIDELVNVIKGLDPTNPILQHLKL
jgi:chromosome segregation ATPase